MRFPEIRAMLRANAVKIDRPAVARLAPMVAARLQAAATREERRRREQAKRIAADGETALAEHISGWTALAHAEEEAILAGRHLSDRHARERAMYFRLRHEVGEAVLRSDPAAARRAVGAWWPPSGEAPARNGAEPCATLVQLLRHSRKHLPALESSRRPPLPARISSRILGYDPQPVGDRRRAET